MQKKIMRTVVCSRGHTFQKSSDCPVCPICWAGYYRERLKGDLPKTIAAPALRALLNAKITSLAALSKYTKAEILELHGIGPSSIPTLVNALKAKGLSFSKDK